MNLKTSVWCWIYWYVQLTLKLTFCTYNLIESALEINATVLYPEAEKKSASGCCQRSQLQNR